MPFDLVTGSRAGLHALFDASDAEVLRAPGLEALEALAAEGRVLLFADALDGETAWRVHVDEEVDETVLASASGWVRGARLHVPSGVLRAAGVGEVTEERASIPRGDYHVDAFTTDWGDALMEHIRARTGHFAGWWYSSGHASVAAFGIVGVVLALALLEPWQSGVALLVMAAVWLGWGRPLQARTRAIVEAARQEHPEVVVLLRPISPDEPIGGVPGVLVPRYAQNVTAPERAP